MRRTHRYDSLWAALLSSRDTQIGVARVPDVHIGVSWWKGMVGYRVRVRDRFGDLDVALGKTSDGTPLFIVGGPGAWEVASPDLRRQEADGAQVLLDPWGNTVCLGRRDANVQNRPRLPVMSAEIES